MRSRLLIIASLLVLPTLATAQRGGSRTQSDRHTDLFDKSSLPKAPLLRTRDIEAQSPLRLLIDKRKDLKLSEAQLSHLNESEGKLDEQNAPLLKMTDSLVRELRLIEAAPSNDDQSHIGLLRMALANVLRAIRTNYDAAAKDALATLDADQQPKATEMLEKQKQDAEKFINEKLGGGQRRGGA